MKYFRKILKIRKKKKKTPHALKYKKNKYNIHRQKKTKHIKKKREIKLLEPPPTIIKTSEKNPTEGGHPMLKIEKINHTKLKILQENNPPLTKKILRV